MEKHYEKPAWLKGSAWQVLEAKGNYSVFLKGVELSGFKPMMEGKSILTIMAPNDSVFNAYLSSHNYAEISDISVQDLKKLIGFHLLYYSYNKERMVNFRPEGDQVTDEEKMANAGLYFKFRSRSANSLSYEINPATGDEVSVYHLERFLPVFSYKFFETKGINAKANYEYFYPNSIWTGSDGFNVSNASVTAYEVIADNGYIYEIDQVLEPLETIYTELKESGRYTEFFNLYDAYSTYEYDATLSADFGKSLGVDSLFLHKHGNDLPPIALEWPVSSYQSVRVLSGVAYSVFAPSNQALGDFFNRFWLPGGYASLADVDRLVMKHLLLQFVYGGSIVFPEEISTGKIKNFYGTLFNFDPQTVSDKAICVNGSFYGLDVINTPPLFASVAGPAFKNKNARGFLYMLDGSSLLKTYASANSSFTLLVPDTIQMNASDIFLNKVGGEIFLQKQTEDGWATVSVSEMQSIVNLHTAIGIGSLHTSGTQICPSQYPFNYWYVKNGKITSSAAFNNYLQPDYAGNPFVAFTEITDNGTPWANGYTYAYASTDGMFAAEASDGLAHALAVCNDMRYEYNAFVQLMKKAGMISGTTVPFLTGSRFIAFIPKNDVIIAALQNGSVPGVTGNGVFDSEGELSGVTINTEILQQYLKSYFIRSTENVFITYPYPGSKVKSGNYMTAGGNKLIYTDSGTSLGIKLENGSVLIPVNSGYDFFPFAFNDGCFHFLDAML